MRQISNDMKEKKKRIRVGREGTDKEEGLIIALDRALGQKVLVSAASQVSIHSSVDVLTLFPNGPSGTSKWIETERCFFIIAKIDKDQRLFATYVLHLATPLSGLVHVPALELPLPL